MPEPIDKKSSIPKMGWHEDVVPQVFGGKTSTWRLRDHKLNVGDVVVFENSQTGELFGFGEITKIVITTVGQIDLNDKTHYQTYKNRQELIEAFKRRNPSYHVDDATPVFAYTYKFRKVGPQNIAPNRSFVELHVHDFKMVKDFYIKILGFEAVREKWLKDDKNYLLLNKQGNLISFWPGSEQVYQHDYFRRFPKETKRGYGVELVFMIDDIKEFYSRVKDQVNIVEPLRTRSWGLKDFRVEDPFGYYLRFTEMYDLIKGPNEAA